MDARGMMGMASGWAANGSPGIIGNGPLAKYAPAYIDAMGEAVKTVLLVWGYVRTFHGNRDVGHFIARVWGQRGRESRVHHEGRTARKHWLQLHLG
jgi:hypothetical protein